MKKGWSSFMERRVKERLVGATILVVLVVLIVPELLSGPKREGSAMPPQPAGAEPVRSVTVDLATNKATAGADDAASAAAAAARDVASGSAPPVAATAGMTPSASPTISTLQAQQPMTAPLESDAASPKSVHTPTMDVAHHGWAAQLGSFAARPNAEKLERQLRGQGFSASLSSSGAGSTLRYRVRVGPVADRAAAEKVTLKLKKAGYSATVVAP